MKPLGPSPTSEKVKDSSNNFRSKNHFRGNREIVIEKLRQRTEIISQMQRSQIIALLAKQEFSD